MMPKVVWKKKKEREDDPAWLSRRVTFQEEVAVTQQFDPRLAARGAPGCSRKNGPGLNAEYLC